jgi:hypothetical protein
MSRERKRGNVRSLQQRGHRVRPSCSPRTPLLMSPLSPTGAATSALLPHRPVRPCGPARRLTAPDVPRVFPLSIRSVSGPRVVTTKAGATIPSTTRTACMGTFLFDTSFDLVDEHGVPYAWRPCREAIQEEPQSEGLRFYRVNSVLYVAFETIGPYKLPSPTCSPRSSGWEWGSSSNRSHRSAVHIARRQTRTSSRVNMTVLQNLAIS